MTPFHQSDEIRAVDGGVLDPKARERFRGRQPPAGGLGRLAAK
jgi:hypothetical protein